MDIFFLNLGIKFWSKSPFKISPGPNFTPHHQLQGSTEWWKTCRKVTCSFFFLRIKITWKQQYTVRCRFQVLASSIFIRLFLIYTKSKVEKKRPQCSLQNMTIKLLLDNLLNITVCIKKHIA